MFQYTNHELAVVISVPIITIVLLWTLVIFYKNKKRWRAYDIGVVAILVESVLRNVSVLSYVTVQKMDGDFINFDYCGGFVWIFNSAHTFQASCLATLAIIAVFSIKIYKKQQHLKQYLTATHVIYHLFCLTTLCACVGVAAILAKQETFDFSSNCKFMPNQLDVKFSAFIIVLHTFLAIVSFASFLYISAIYWRMKPGGGGGGFDYMKKSTSDLSQLSLSTVNRQQESNNKHFYDTYTVQRNGSYGRYDQAQLNGYNTIWKSDISNVSTTVSSTNSRKPLNSDKKEESNASTGLETINPILVVCYLFYHVPIIILCIFPHLIEPWPVSTAALWLGLLQDVLLPVSLGVVDSRFNRWVSNVYRCSGKRQVEGKLPHVGLDGKFRHFGSQPQSLEINQMLPERIPAPRCYQNNEHKFPITNGSLYTSIDGRVPVIHNYRRHHNNEIRGTKLDGNVLNLGLHSSNLQRQKKQSINSYRCNNCDSTDNSNSDLIRNSVYNLNIGSQNQILLKPYLRHISLSQNSLARIPLGQSRDFSTSVLNLNQNRADRNNLRLSKSCDSLNELQNDLSKFKRSNTSEDSDDDDYTSNQNFDTMSTESSYSITTEANCDFEFFQHEKGDFGRDSGKITSQASSKSSLNELGKNFKITRSNSKRSLENLQAYIESDEFFSYSSSLQRSNSFTSTVDRKKPLNVSVEFLHNNREGTFLDSPFNRANSQQQQQQQQFYAGSVPDLKKIFISEYL